MALNNSQYESIMRLYEQKQIYSRDQLHKRFSEVYDKIPEIKELNESISRLSVAKARSLISGNEHALDGFHEEIRSFSARKAELLTAHGYPADYLEPVYECPDCQDTGYHDQQKCHCFKRAVIDLLYTQSNLKEILHKENFHTFSLDYYSDNYVDPATGKSSLETIKNALKLCHDYVDQFGQTGGNLFFYGDPGVGKTFLSNCIAKELIEQSFSVIYFTAFNLFDVLAKSSFEKDDSAAVMAEHILDCDLLIIDDLGTEFANSFTTTQFFTCINERLFNKKATIISTNLSLDDFNQLYSERTFSRISSNYTMLKLTGDDIRIKKKLMKQGR